MSPEALRDLQYRCRRAIAAPIPQHILEGGTRAAADYKQCASVCAAFLRTGTQAEKARIYVLRLEGAQGLGVSGSAAHAGVSAGAAVARSPSLPVGNHGENLNPTSSQVLA